MANNQQLNGLRTINNLQRDGSLQNLLLSIKTSKVEVDALSKKLMARKSKIKEEKAAAERAVSEAQTPVKEQQTEKVADKKEVTGVVESAPAAPVSQMKQAGSTTNFNRSADYRDRQNGDRDYNRQNNGRNYQGGYQNNNFRNNSNYQGGNRPRFDSNSRPNNGQNHFDGQNRRPGPFNRQDQQGQKNKSFVSTKANNFKSFAKTEPAPVPQPERNFGNKNKQRRNVEDPKKQTLKQSKSHEKNNILVMDDEGYEETTMGSRKLNKKKREVQEVAVSKVTHAVLNSRDISIKDLSEKIGKPVAEIVKKLMLLGIMATINSSIDFDTCELICSDFGITLELKMDKSYEEKLIDAAAEDDDKDLVKRPPIVTVMGHVDHGKTSLLDAFRKTNVVLGEAGGITQKIGAYQISFNNEKITFIDTPGHAAFTAMRARGAEVTDVAILVVAADDGVMPQTIEAINHIKAAKVPMIVAINKMDKPEANPDRIKQQLAENGVLPEEWGGDAICVPISAKTGQGLDDLKQTILLVAEMEELKANPNRNATGVIIEAELDKNRGPIATVLVQNGTLKVGDSIISGITYGKIKAMFDENGKPVKKAPPSTPVSVMGFNDVPSSGDQVHVVDDSLSKHVISERINKLKEERSKQTSGVTADDFMDRVHEGDLKSLNIIIKADTQGSVEALRNSLEAIRNDEVKVVTIHSAAGAITESDLLLAQTTGSVIVAFNIKTPSKTMALADSLKVNIIESRIIYEVVEQVTLLSKGMMSIKYEEKYIGSAEIRVVFKLSSAGKVAGCYVTDGKVQRKAIAKIKRNGEVVFESTIDSLKIVKDEKSEVAKGFECGIKLKDSGFDYAEGDVIECYVKEQIKNV